MAIIRLLLPALLAGVSMATSTRIVGGKQVKRDHYPFYAALCGESQSPCLFLCSASLVDPHFVMTAAHCIDAGRPITEVHINAYEFNATDEHTVIRHPKTVFVHPGWSQKLQNDIALIQLDEPVWNIAPVPLNFNADLPFDQEKVRAVGLGLVDQDAKTDTDFLKSIKMKAITNERCNKKIQALWKTKQQVISDDMLCASRSGGGVCKGDSGGPLLAGCGSQVIQTGVVSWGPGRCNDENPQVFARVSAFEDWITNILPTGRFRYTVTTGDSVTSPRGSVFVTPEYGVGIDSLHFVDAQDFAGSYLSNENAWQFGITHLDDGVTPYPERLFLTDVAYNDVSRTLTCAVDWPSPNLDATRWEYELVFAEDFSQVSQGFFRAYNGDGIQLVEYTIGHPSTGAHSWYVRYGSSEITQTTWTADDFKQAVRDATGGTCEAKSLGAFGTYQPFFHPSWSIRFDSSNANCQLALDAFASNNNALNTALMANGFGELAAFHVTEVDDAPGPVMMLAASGAPCEPLAPPIEPGKSYHRQCVYICNKYWPGGYCQSACKRVRKFRRGRIFVCRKKPASIKKHYQKQCAYKLSTAISDMIDKCTCEGQYFCGEEKIRTLQERCDESAKVVNGQGYLTPLVWPGGPGGPKKNGKDRSNLCRDVPNCPPPQPPVSQLPSCTGKSAEGWGTNYNKDCEVGTERGQCTKLAANGDEYDHYYCYHASGEWGQCDCTP